jgi:hypothetical protein
MGANVYKQFLPLDPPHEVWAMSAQSYVKSAVSNVQKELTKMGLPKLSSSVYWPMKQGYCPEVDITNLLSDDMANFYQD